MRIKTKSTLPAAALGALVAASIAIACDYEAPKDAKQPCDTTLVTCALRTPYQFNGQWQCNPAYYVAQGWPTACKSVESSNNCGQVTQLCSYVCNCTPNINHTACLSGGPVGAPNYKGEWTSQVCTN